MMAFNLLWRPLKAKPMRFPTGIVPLINQSKLAYTRQQQLTMNRGSLIRCMNSSRNTSPSWPESIKEKRADEKLRQQGKVANPDIIEKNNGVQEQTKEDNKFSLLRKRLKWVLKKSNRPFNADDYSAFFSWIVVGNALFFILGTTTFLSLVILTFNTVFAQEFVARKIGEFITKNTKMRVTFEHAVVPGWSQGKICFKKCFVSRRPRVSTKFVKGSQAEAEAYSARLTDTQREKGGLIDEKPDDGNYTQFDLTIEEMNMSLSFKKWLNGTGIIESLEIKGMRGVVDRDHIRWAPNDDPTRYKNVYKPGDFEIEDFKMQDVLFKLIQPNNFRHFDVAIYNCELSRLRKHWLFYDFLNANIMSGSFDNSLFTIHKRQRLDEFSDMGDNEPVIISQKWKRINRLRIDGLNIDHLNRGVEGPFGWIVRGRVDLVGDLKLPEQSKDLNMSEIVNMITESITKAATRKKTADGDANFRASQVTKPTDLLKYLVLDMTLRLTNVHAVVPFATPDLSYVNYALIRPIVAYINSRNAFIEINSTIAKNIADFEGSWTLYDSLLIDDISAEVYDSFVRYVADEESRLIRMKKVGFWSLQLFLQLVIFGLGSLA